MLVDVTKDPRMSGQVRRYHTWPVLRQQTLAEHQWQVARIVLAIYPMASPELLKEALFHDAGELSTGDLPMNAKLGNPELNRMIKDAENTARLGMALQWGVPAPHGSRLGGIEAMVLHLADRIEMWEFAIEEQMLGNRFADLIRQRGEDVICGILSQAKDMGFPSYDSVRNVVEIYMNRREETWTVRN